MRMFRIYIWIISLFSVIISLEIITEMKNSSNETEKIIWKREKVGKYRIA